MKSTPLMLLFIGLTSLILGVSLLLTGSIILGIISTANSLMAAEILHRLTEEEEK